MAESPQHSGAGKAAEVDAARQKNGSPAKKAAILSVIALLVIAGASWGIRAWRFGQGHVSTDDAFVTGNLVNVSPVIQGTLNELKVDEGSAVKKDQLIGRLDDSAQQAALRQSEAALQSARTQVEEARSALRFQAASTEAGIRKAESAVAAQKAKTTGAEQ